jgi:hypothetical protein
VNASALLSSLPGLTSLDPAIHHLKKAFCEVDGCAGHLARRRASRFSFLKAKMKEADINYAELAKWLKSTV